MAEMVHDGWYALRGTPEPRERKEQAARAAALYNSGATWQAMREEMHCCLQTLSMLLREGGIVVGSRTRGRAGIVPPESFTPVEKWTREVQTTPSPCMDAALDRHTAAIRQMHADLGIAPPVLP